MVEHICKHSCKIFSIYCNESQWEISLIQQVPFVPPIHDKYYVIGIDKDVDTNVVTIWSKEVEVAPGENLVELTSTDVIYQE